VVCGTDLHGRGVPIITITLILLNAVLFLTIPEDAVDTWTFLPHGNPSGMHVVASVVTSAFLHGSFWHLVGNMFFLGTFGGPVEQRIGAGRFLLVYFLSIITSEVIILSLLALQVSSVDLSYYHSIGASGAISGMMGLFAVRCFFSKVKVGLFFPWLTLPLSIPIPIPSMLLIGLFLACNLNGAAQQYTDSTSSHVDYLAHVGGYLGGFVFGFVMRLHREASKEAVHVRAARLGQRNGPGGKTTEAYRDILAAEPEHLDALRYFVSLYKFSPDKASPYYGKLVQMLVRKDFAGAIEVFDDYYPALTKALPAESLMQFGIHFYKNGALDKARYCFELCSETESGKAKGLLWLGRTFQAIGNAEMARRAFEQVISYFPDTPFSTEANNRLTVIKPTNDDSEFSEKNAP
jgi:membrane associated rhomboid family serine protease